MDGDEIVCVIHWSFDFGFVSLGNDVIMTVDLISNFIFKFDLI